MERPIFKSAGTPVEHLDTPSLIVDLAALEYNIETMHSFFIEGDTKLRPHMDSHGCPTIAQKQLAAGGTVEGICVTTVGQAEVFAASGFTDIFITNVVVTRPKIARICALSKHVKITIAVDSTRNVSDLSQAAIADGINLELVVDIRTKLNRCGVNPGQPAVEMAKTINSSEALNFAGLMSYEAAIFNGDTGDFATESRRWIQQILDTRETIEKAGIDVGVVSIGGTHNYEIAGRLDGVTEIPAGSYALMDARYRDHRPQFKPAAKIMATVTSIPDSKTVLTDAGQKAIGTDTGLPTVDNMPGAKVNPLSAEHGSITPNPRASDAVNLGDKVWHTPWDIGACINLHDYIHGIRKDKLEVVWDIPARGHYR